MQNSEEKTGRKTVLEPLLVLGFSIVLGISGAGDQFCGGTTINGIDVSGMTVTEATHVLAETADQYVLKLDFRDGHFEAGADDFDLRLNPDVSLRKMMWQQVRSERKMLEYYVPDLYLYDAGLLKKTLLACDALKSENMIQPENASLIYDEKQDAFVLEAGAPGTTLAAEALIRRAGKYVQFLKSPLDADALGFYKVADLTPEGPLGEQVISEADALTQMDVSYIFHDGESETVDREFLAPLVVLNDQLEPVIDQKQLKKKVSRMAGDHEAEDATIYFETTGGDKIPFEYPADDDAVDKTALQKDIMACVQKQSTGEHIVPYKGEAAENDHNFGGNYIEVDLDEQVLYLYKEGKMVMTTEIVSGSTWRSSRMTPTGVYRVYNMLRDVTLTGDDYESDVSYWMPFKGGYGLHDATWRSHFGGNIYTYNGSHGCVNMPLDKARELYESIDVGYRVVVYDESMKGESDNEDDED